MEKEYTENGDLVIRVDEETIVKVSKGAVMFRQEAGGTERVFLTKEELRKVIEIMDKEGV